MLAIGNMDTMTGGVTPGIKIKFDDNGIEYQSKRTPADTHTVCGKTRFTTLPCNCSNKRMT